MKISIDIERFRRIAYDLDPVERDSYLSLLFTMRTFGEVDEQLIPVKLHHLEIWEINERGWIDEDVFKQRAVDAVRKKNGQRVKKVVKNKRVATESLPSRKRVASHPRHNDLITAYHDWYVDRYSVKPLIQVKDAASVKRLLAWLDSNVGSKGNDIIDGFKWILSRWDKLDDFTQKQTDLVQIASNINSITTQFKINGNKKTTGAIHSKEEWTEILSRRYNEA